MKIGGTIIEAIVDEELRELAGDFGCPTQVVMLAAIRLLRRDDVEGFNAACEVEEVLSCLDKRPISEARAAYILACEQNGVSARIREVPIATPKGAK